jgi:anti-sigma B factor antagonist
VSLESANAAGQPPLARRKTCMPAHRLNQPGRTAAPGTHLRYVDGTELFSVVVPEPNSAEVYLHVAGDIDLLAEPSLQAHLSTLLANRPECLIIDLSQVSFMGATGLSVLIKARHAAALQGTKLRLQNPSRRAVRPLEIMGLDRLFEMQPPPTEQN